MTTASKYPSAQTHHTKESIVAYLEEQRGARIVFDYALPQSWVDYMTVHTGEMHVAAHFVWEYPSGSFSGRPLPLSEYAEELLKAAQEDEELCKTIR